MLWRCFGPLGAVHENQRARPKMRPLICLRIDCLRIDCLRIDFLRIDCLRIDCLRFELVAEHSLDAVRSQQV